MAENGKHRGSQANAGVKRFDDEGGTPKVKKTIKMCVDESGEALSRKGHAAVGIDKNEHHEMSTFHDLSVLLFVVFLSFSAAAKPAIWSYGRNVEKRACLCRAVIGTQPADKTQSDSRAEPGQGDGRLDRRLDRRSGVFFSLAWPRSLCSLCSPLY